MWRFQRICGALRTAPAAHRRPAALGFATATFAGGAAAAEGQPESPPKRGIWVKGREEPTGDVLGCTYDTYGGVVVEKESVPTDVAAFKRCVAASVDAWRKAGRRGVWLKIDAGQTRLLPEAVDTFGFEIHHAEKGHIVLTKWLPDTPSSIPHNASHTVGVGAVIRNAKGETLLVKERSGPAARMNVWKMPTGLVAAGEELHEAAVREVKEETGIDVECDGISSLMVSHAGNLAHEGKSNIFFVCRCRALHTDISLNDGELSDARWFSDDEYAGLPHPAKGSVFEALSNAARDSSAPVFHPVLRPLGPRRASGWGYVP
eukprot:TRINITY_DN18946_c0_g1_i1.p1 TRINITY_DN18946_c0_g1~~TRINITY_DN18946_c0_g1_i1.p1  ORF type:complete len:318 (+),score=89.77 TRINITY_DN18946_c0_g1_i1:101-1054(+)